MGGGKRTSRSLAELIVTRLDRLELVLQQCLLHQPSHAPGYWSSLRADAPEFVSYVDELTQCMSVCQDAEDGDLHRPLPVPVLGELPGDVDLRGPSLPVPGRELCPGGVDVWELLRGTAPSNSGIVNVGCVVLEGPPMELEWEGDSLHNAIVAQRTHQIAQVLSDLLYRVEIILTAVERGAIPEGSSGVPLRLARSAHDWLVGLADRAPSSSEVLQQTLVLDRVMDQVNQAMARPSRVPTASDDRRTQVLLAPRASRGRSCRKPSKSHRKQKGLERRSDGRFITDR